MRGVFWIIDDKLYAIPYDETADDGLSKNRTNYNHRLLWEHVRPKGINKRFDYYPRGRVEYTPKGKPLVFLGLSVDRKFIPQICEAFELTEEPRIHYDGSEHYMSHEERMKQRGRRKNRILKE